MFNKLPNHLEANHLLKIFSPFFKYTEFVEEIDTKNKNIINYIAITPDKWKVTISFANRKDNKSYCPTIVFNKIKDINNQNAPTERQQKRKELISFMQITYRPNFDRMMNVLRVFIAQGIKSGLFKSSIERKYNPHMRSHIDINHYRGRLRLSDNNFGTIQFNRLLQKATGYKRDHYKQSYLSVSIDFLVHADSSIHPYFKIRLPYNDKKKTTCVIPLMGEEKVYFMNNDDHLNKKPIDQMKYLPMNNEVLKVFFEDEFQKEVKNLIAKTLNISKSDIADATADELKDYFELVEMIKI